MNADGMGRTRIYVAVVGMARVTQSGQCLVKDKVLDVAIVARFIGTVAEGNEPLVKECEDDVSRQHKAQAYNFGCCQCPSFHANHRKSKVAKPSKMVTPTTS